MGIFRQFPYSNFHEMNLDDIIKIMREMQDEWYATKQEWATYKDFIDNYFANLDVSEEVLSALRVFAEDGTLNEIIDPVIAESVTDWLTEHVTPTTPIIDNSLTISGAGADARVVGVTGGFLRFKGMLAENADISSLDVGVYGLTDAVATSIADIPVNYGGNLIVTKASANGTITQIYHSSSANLSECYWRNGISSAWASGMGLNGSLTSSDTFANIATPGSYAVTNAVAQAISDAPIGAGGILFVMKASPGTSTSQLYLSNERRMYWRSTVNETWVQVFGYCGLLTASNTYANINDIGMYGVTTAVNGQISDAPVASGGTLLVVKGSPSGTRTQIFFANNRAMYWRNASDSWNKSFGYMGSMTSSMLFNTLTEIGIYAINDSNASSITDSPSEYGGVVLVAKSVQSATPIQLFFCTTGQVYWRYGTNDWNKLSIEARNTYFVRTCVAKPVPLNGKGIFIFGDSIATSSHGGFTWGSVLASLTGATEYNYAVGSSAFVHRDELNLRIIDQINAVDASDWQHCDVVFVAGGTNDANYETTATNLRNAVWNVISAIRTNAPNARIIFITPIQRYDEFYNRQLPRIAGAIANVALENDIDVINGFDIPIPTYSNDWIHEDTDNDGTHPKATGKRIYAKAILNAIM